MANIELICKNCQKIFIVPYKARTRKFCSRECVNLYQVGSRNPAYGKTYRTKDKNPEWAKKVSDTHLLRCHISGDKNPMKNKEVAAKVGASRSEKFKNDDSFRKSVSDLVKKAWEDGKYDGVSVGKCKWYKFTKKDGTTCNTQGSWELAYANWLDKQDIVFIAHRGKLSYIDADGSRRSYYPDFFLPETNEFIDIKNRYHFSLNNEKWNQIRSSNPDIKLVLLFEEDLKEKGIL